MTQTIDQLLEEMQGLRARLANSETSGASGDTSVEAKGDVPAAIAALDRAIETLRPAVSIKPASPVAIESTAAVPLPIGEPENPAPAPKPSETPEATPTAKPYAIVSEAPGAPDNLKSIRGISSATASALGSLGITRFAHVAGLRATDVAALKSDLGYRCTINRDNWIEQAAVLAAGGSTQFSRRGAPIPVSASPEPEESRREARSEPQSDTIEDVTASEPVLLPQPADADSSPKGANTALAASLAAAAGVFAAKSTEPDRDPQSSPSIIDETDQATAAEATIDLIAHTDSEPPIDLDKTASERGIGELPHDSAPGDAVALHTDANGNEAENVAMTAALSTTDFDAHMDDRAADTDDGGAAEFISEAVEQPVVKASEAAAPQTINDTANPLSSREDAGIAAIAAATSAAAPKVVDEVLETDSSPSEIEPDISTDDVPGKGPRAEVDDDVFATLPEPVAVVAEPEMLEPQIITDHDDRDASAIGINHDPAVSGLLHTDAPHEHPLVVNEIEPAPLIVGQEDLDDNMSPARDILQDDVPDTVSKPAHHAFSIPGALRKVSATPAHEQNADDTGGAEPVVDDRPPSPAEMSPTNASHQTVMDRVRATVAPARANGADTQAQTIGDILDAESDDVISSDESDFEPLIVGTQHETESVEIRYAADPAAQSDPLFPSNGLAGPANDADAGVEPSGSASRTFGDFDSTSGINNESNGQTASGHIHDALAEPFSPHKAAVGEADIVIVRDGEPEPMAPIIPPIEPRTGFVGRLSKVFRRKS